MCNIYASAEVRAAFYLRPVYPIQDLAHVGCERSENLWTLSRHAHEANG